MLSKKMKLSLSTKRNLLIALLSALLLVAIFLFAFLRGGSVEYRQIEQLIKTKQIQQAIIQGETLHLLSNDERYTLPLRFVDIERLEGIPIVIEPKRYLFVYFICLGFVGLLGYLLFRTSKKEPLKIKEHKNTQPQHTISPIYSKIKLSDVAGIDDVKDELLEIIDFIKEPSKYHKMGARLPKGILLIGSPGVGKTLIAKALAGEVNVPFFYQNGSSFNEIYVGVGAKRVRELFKRAKALAPSIIFIDEIDSIGKSRGQGNDERESTLNQLLTHMDGFESDSGVVVLGATNKLEMLDEALLRAGRFDRRLFIPLPNQKEREDILKLYLKAHRIDTERLAKLTIGFSGAMLETLVNEALLYAIRQNRDSVLLEDFEAIKDKVLVGKIRLTLSEEEKKIQALYQGAKAVIGYWFGIEFERVGLISVQVYYSTKEILSEDEYLNLIAFHLSGVLACEVRLNQKFNNAKEDTERVQALSEEMVKIFMGKKSTAVIIEESYASTKVLLKQFEEAIECVSEHLLAHEAIEKEQIKRVVDALF